MKFFNKYKIKKLFKSLRRGVFGKKTFFVIFGIYFSTLALASNLTVTFIGALIPGGNNNTPIGNTPAQQCRGNDDAKSLMHTDRTTAPTDIEFNDDGSFVYTSNFNMSGMSQNSISQNKLLDNYQILSDAIRKGTFNCDHLKGADPEDQSGDVLGDATHDIEIHQNGKLFFFLDTSRKLGKFTASIPYDLNTLTFVQKLDLNGTENSIEFSKDGTKIFALAQGANTPTLTTYQLPGAYDISSKTEIHSVDLYDLDIEDVTDKDEYAQDIEFNSDGSAMFIFISNEDIEEEYIYHYDLAKNYDVSTAVKIGRFHVGAIFLNRKTTGDSPLFGNPGGFGFSRDGMNLYLLDGRNGQGVHQINQFKLDCPYGLVKCSPGVSFSSVEATVELAKQNVSLNVTSIFKRFEWIKRNRDDENLTAHNFNINYTNPIIKNLANKFEPSIQNNIASFVSKHKAKNKVSKWSSWSLGDVSLSIFGADENNPKNINTRGLTFGADRKFGDNKFLGWALRYGDSSTDIKLSPNDVTMESLTLNLYGISPTDDNNYINAVLGLSLLRYDHRHQGIISGNRNGKQAFASINYRTDNKYGMFNVTPTGKLILGITQLSEFTDFLSRATGLSSKDIIYKKDTFASGELALGFLFETDMIDTNQGTVQPMGGIELLTDFTPDIDYKYVYQGGTHVNKDTIHGQFSRRNLKTSIGFEAIHLNGFTVLTDYQRVIRLTDASEAPEYQTETFIIKFSRSKEEDNQFALNYDPINAHQTNLSYSKNIHGLDFKINSNQSLENSSEYFTNLEVSGKF